jgi:hypothetical protein
MINLLLVVVDQVVAEDVPALNFLGDYCLTNEEEKDVQDDFSLKYRILRNCAEG